MQDRTPVTGDVSFIREVMLGLMDLEEGREVSLAEAKKRLDLA